MITTGYEEKREFTREDISIPFIYSLDKGNSLLEGEWKEAVTLDIGPVLVGGIGFNTTRDDFREGQAVRVALFMDLKIKEVWERERENFPIIYDAKVLRVTDRGDHKRVALVFGGMISGEEEKGEA
jgi:hypothetical protein